MGLPHDLRCLWSLSWWAVCFLNRLSRCSTYPGSLNRFKRSHFCSYADYIFGCTLMWRTTWIGMWPTCITFLIAHCVNDPCKLPCLLLPWSPWKQTCFERWGFADCAGEGESQCGAPSPGIFCMCLLQDVGAEAWTADRPLNYSANSAAELNHVQASARMQH